VLKFADSFALPQISSGLTSTVTTSGGYHVVKFTAGTGTIRWVA
jgi:hypothetical protein